MCLQADRGMCGQAHGIIMAVAWGLILPIGVLTSRYGKGFALWLHAHRAIQVGLPRSLSPGFSSNYTAVSLTTVQESRAP